MPGNIRARFTSRQIIVSTLVAMLAGIGIGRFIDAFEGGDKQIGFDIVFSVGANLRLPRVCPAESSPVRGWKRRRRGGRRKGRPGPPRRALPGWKLPPGGAVLRILDFRPGHRPALVQRLHARPSRDLLYEDLDLQRRLHGHQHPRLPALGQPHRPFRQQAGTADPHPSHDLPAFAVGRQRSGGLHPGPGGPGALRRPVLRDHGRRDAPALRVGAGRRPTPLLPGLLVGHGEPDGLPSVPWPEASWCTHCAT